MPKQPRKPTTNAERAAQFDIAAHQKEIDRLLRENAKLKAQQFTLQRELAMRPSYSEAQEPELDAEALRAEWLRIKRGVTPTAS